MSSKYHQLLITALLCVCIKSVQPTEISCQDAPCEEVEKVPGLICCKYENLASDAFNYVQVLLRSNPYGLYYSVNSLDVQQFIVSKSNISKIPENLFQNIKELEYLSVINSGLRNIEINDFLDANHLIYLNLTNNSIQILEPKLFIHASKLQTLDLSFNKISQLSEYVFDHLEDLQKLYLSNNNLVRFDSKNGFNNLELFMIDNNLLTEIDENTFQNSTKLRELNLRNNNLSIHNLSLPRDVTLDIFDISNNLAAISVSAKNISIQHTNTVTYFIHRSVQILDASNNQISSIQIDGGLNLIHLNLSKNNLSSAENLTNLINLQHLDLSFNSLKDLSISSFSEMGSLQILNLKSSGLHSLEFGTFSHQTNLISLDISDNNLMHFSFNTLTFLSSLTSLNINGNQLTDIDVTDITTLLPNLVNISISNNLFQCNDLIEIMKTLNDYHLHIDVNKDTLVKDTNNIRGIRCFSDLNDNSFRTSDDALLGDSTSNVDFNKFEMKTNSTIHKLKKDLTDLRDTVASFKNQFLAMEEQLNEHLHSFNESNASSKISSELDAWNFSLIFVILILVLLMVSGSSYLYVKFLAARSYKYTQANQCSTNVDQTLV